MKLFLVLAAISFLASPTLAQFEHPQSHTEYDWRTGNRYQVEHHNDIFEQDTHIRGSNIYTGSRWETTIDNDGDMRGRDADGNSWQYDSGSRSYQNVGTGKTCVGSGPARTCY